MTACLFFCVRGKSFDSDFVVGAVRGQAASHAKDLNDTMKQSLSVSGLFLAGKQKTARLLWNFGPIRKKREIALQPENAGFCRAFLQNAQIMQDGCHVRVCAQRMKVSCQNLQKSFFDRQNLVNLHRRSGIGPFQIGNFSL